MQESNPFFLIFRRMSEQKSSIELHLARGYAKTHEDYWKLVGSYETLERIEEEIKEIEQRYIAD